MILARVEAPTAGFIPSLSERLLKYHEQLPSHWDFAGGHRVQQHLSSRLGKLKPPQ